MYTLGDITLPRPKNMVRRQVETGATVITLDGTTKKDIISRKEQFVLEYTLLTQAEVASILGEYNLQTTRNLAINETNLTVSTTPVHIEIEERQYNTKGNEYREDLTLVLTEVV
jgi:hypothetical protein